MRIAILSLVLHTNYGGILQSYALQTVLERMGHKVEVLSTPIKCSRPKWYRWPLCLAKRIIKKVMGRNNSPIFVEKYRDKLYPIISQHTQTFIDSHIHVRYIESFFDINEKDYDAIIVGSDQVWRPRYFKSQWHSAIENAFLSFTKGWNINRIAYAPSFGVDNCEYSDTELSVISKLLRGFNLISVREDSGIQLLKNHFGVDSIKVVDPTLLLSKDDYFGIVKNESQSKGNLLVYMLDESEDKRRFINFIAEGKHLEPFSVKASAEEIQPKVETWIKGFADAELIVTDSFHACVFSIIFRKPFWVLGNKMRGNTRFDSLLAMFDLQRRCISAECAENIDFNSPIEWNKIESLLTKERIRCLDCLNKSCLI
ncbi:MAG: polysaccharide pyruvyl transferase family protein [Bacteroidales bacterium]|nr:polysaccharide pyruvyl transferase family protein [Candidatus Physcocola equi]